MTRDDDGHGGDDGDGDGGDAEGLRNGLDESETANL